MKIMDYEVHDQSIVFLQIEHKQDLVHYNYQPRYSSPERKTKSKILFFIKKMIKNIENYLENMI